MLFEKQKFQEDCVNNIISVLKDFDFEINDTSVLKSNLTAFYNSYNIPKKNLSDKLKLDVLMETGTGKTFAYIKTIFELHKNYGLNKFIIFVPRKAIREGVIQNINLTSNYFFEEYGKRLHKYTYDGDKSIGSIKTHYIRNKDELSVLILTAASIDKETNILRRSDENLFHDKSIFDAITKINPIIFIDEPHLLKGEAFTKIFNLFNSLHIRFGATYPQESEHSLSNMIYSLDSLSSFKNYLVKKIRVNTIINNENSIKIYSIELKKKEARINYFYNNDEYSKTINFNEDIGAITGLKDYAGVNIVKATKSDVYLSNGKNLKITDKYELTDEEIRLMIRKTIEIHFSKEEKLFNKGIKTLSLFFIQNVSDFRGDNPKVKNIFEEEYRTKRNEIYSNTKNDKYKEYLSKDYDNDNNIIVHQGYFSGDKGKNQEDKDIAGIDLILSEKEKLLSFDASLRFIFSVWALQEGWDNPNVFNLCKLSNTDKETSRRQQVGRGLRLAVNQDGRRITNGYLNEDKSLFYDINTLDVIVSGHENQFISEIQKEIIDNSFIISTGILKRDSFNNKGFTGDELNRLFIALIDNNIIIEDVEPDKYIIKSPVKEFILSSKEKLKFLTDDKYKMLLSLFDFNHDNYVENANKQKEKIKIRPHKMKEFTELWETINKKSSIVYEDLNEEELINSISSGFNKINIPEVNIKYISQEYDPETNEIKNIHSQVLGKVDFFKNHEYQQFIYDLAKKEKFPLLFLLKTFNKIKIDKIKSNPKEAKTILTEIIKEEVHKNIIQKVDYKFENEIKITTLHENGKYKSEVVYTDIGKFLGDIAPDNFLFERIIYDSEIEKKSIGNEYLNINKNKIVVFAKLPKIAIPTPYKTYNPDFAYLLETEQKKKLFLIVETKGYDYENLIPPEELKKIEYAEIFFKKLQKEIGNTAQIIFKKRINKQELTDLLKEFE